MLVYVNGEFHPKEKAVVSVFDHGYLYGDGIYETLRAYDGEVFRVREHAERLKRSADMIELRLPFDTDGAVDAINETVKRNGLKDAYIRMTVSRGPGELGLDPDLCPEPTVVIIAKELKPYPAEMYEKGIEVIVANTRRNHPEALNPAIKSTNFLNNIFAKIEAKKAGAYEAIMLNHEGYVTEGTISNVFLVKGNTLTTPHESTGILMGVTRRMVLELGRREGLVTDERAFHKDELYDADEVFITNTTMEVMPVTGIDGRKVAGGKVGEYAVKLKEAYEREVLSCLKTRPS